MKTNIRSIKTFSAYLLSLSFLLAPMTCLAIDFAGSLKGVTITDAQGINKPPLASFAYTIDGGTVTFDASGSTAPEGSITEYNWDFGDGSKAQGQLVTRQYDITLNKQVTLTVTDNLNSIAITQNTILAAGCANILFHDNLNSPTNSYKTASDDYYAFSGGRWTGPNKTICGAEFWISAVSGDVSAKNFSIKIFSTDTNNDLATLKGTSETIPGSNISIGWTGIVSFPTPVDINSGDAIVLTEENNLLDNSKYLVLGEDNSTSGNFDEGIWGSDFVDRRLWSRAVLVKFYE